MYLYGSLASGDFDPESSDIDFAIATTDDLDGATIDRLKAMHNAVKANGGQWARHLEGCYISLAKLCKYTPDQSVPHLNEHGFEVRTLGPDWVFQRQVIRGHRMIVAGPDPRKLIDAVSKENIQRAVHDVLVNYWSKSIEDPSWLKQKKYQAFAVLTMCRALYAFKLGEIVSKPEAANWAAENHATWAPLIRRSLTERASRDESDYSQALDFIKFTINYVQ